MAETDKSFWGHLDDLRKVLFKMAGVLAVFMAGFFYFMPWLFDNVIMAPCHGDFAIYRLFADITGSIPGLEAFSTSDFNVEIINYNLTAQFFTHINLSLWLAVVLRFPCCFICCGRLSDRHFTRRRCAERESRSRLAR